MCALWSSSAGNACPRIGYGDEAMQIDRERARNLHNRILINTLRDVLAVEEGAIKEQGQVIKSPR